MRVIGTSLVRRLLVIACTVALLFSAFSSPSAAADSKGIVTGSLRTFGGVVEATRAGYPTAGRVVFKPEHGTARAIKVGKTGRFTVELKPGTYTVFGGPPAWNNTCQVNFGKPFSLSAGEKVKVTVSCLAL
jgi:hypothetical protein